MACGSVAQSEGAITLASLNLTRCDLTSSPNKTEQGESPTNRAWKSAYRGETTVHDAILFLQKEHEKILTGLHVQIEALQQKCDQFQFEAHLRHVITSDEEVLRRKVSELTKTIKEKNSELTVCKQQLDQQEKASEEEKEQHRWKELKLQQQLEVSNQRSAEMKAEIARLRAQVHDLKVFSSALRTSSGAVGGAPSPSPRQHHSGLKSPMFKHPISPASPHRTSQESLDSQGPRSLGSEEGDFGTWKEARLGSGGGKLTTSLRGTRPQSSNSVSLPPLSPSSGVPQPPPSSTFTLPPITQAGSSTSSSTGANFKSRPYVRKQLRLLSAPTLDPRPKSNKYPP